MASPVPDNWASLNCGDIFEGVEVPEINSALLASLLDESYGDSDENEEKLRSVMQSLEAEISPIRGDIPSGEIEYSINWEECDMSDVRPMDGLNCSMSSNIDSTWSEMEVAPPASTDNMTYDWYADPYGDEMSNNMIDVGDLTEFTPLNYGMAEEQHDFSSLWQETYDPAMYAQGPAIHTS